MMEEKKNKASSLFGFPRYQALLRALLGGIGKTAMVLPASFLVSLGLGITGLGMIFYLRDLFGASPSVIGALFATWNASYFVGCIFLRPLSRLILPRYSMLSATVVMGLCMVVLIVTGNLAAIFVFYGVYGLSTSFFFPPLMGWLSAGVEGQALNRVMGRFNLSWSIGGIVSPYVAGFLVHKKPVYSVYGSMSVFFLATLIILIASLSILRIKNDVHLDRNPNADDGPIKKGTYLRFPSWGGIFFSYLSLGILTSIFPLHARDVLGIPEITVGLLFTLRACASVGGFYLMSKTEAWHFNRPFLVSSQFLSLALLVVMMFAGSLPLIIITILAWGMINSANYSIGLFHGAAGATERLKRMAFHEAILTAGAMAGSLLGGALYQRFSMKTAFGAAAVLQGLLIVFSIVYMAVKRNENPVV